MTVALTDTLRIVIADDHALFREGLKSLLRLQSDMTVVGEAARIDHLQPMIRETRSDILLLDLGMERSSLVEIKELAKQVQVIVVTASERPEDGIEAVRSGARAVVFKRFASSMLLTAIRSVAEGNVWMPPCLQTQVASGLRELSAVPMTPRELEVIRHVALGLRNIEVATKLFISEQTVKTHLNNIFQKLRIRDRVELVLYAARVGIIGIFEDADR